MGVSLNNTLLAKPTIQCDLFQTLTRFQMHHVLSADIAKMYRQVNIKSEDCDYLRILWRDSNDKSDKNLSIKNCNLWNSIGRLHFWQVQLSSNWQLKKEASIL